MSSFNSKSARVEFSRFTASMAIFAAKNVLGTPEVPCRQIMQEWGARGEGMGGKEREGGREGER